MGFQSAGTRLVDAFKFVRALSPVVPSGAAPRVVNLANYNHATIVISVKNATSVAGAAITLLQSTNVAGAGSKALAFDKVFANLDCAAGDTLAETAVASNTFTTGTTNSKELMYLIEVDATTLDVNSGFSCLKVGVADATAATVSVDYILSGARFGGNVAGFPSAIVN